MQDRQLRYYSLTNFYLSDIQKGIQTAHVIADTAVEVKKNEYEKHLFFDWAKNHKTIIVLNGGNSIGLISAYNNIKRIIEEYKLYETTVHKFNEDEQSLNCALTAVGVVCPYFDGIEILESQDFPQGVTNELFGLNREPKKYGSDDPMRYIELQKYLNNFRLA